LKGFLVGVLLFLSFVARGESFTVSASGPSLFGEGRPVEGFDYRGWAADRAEVREDFDVEQWDELAPVPTHGGVLTRSQAEWLLVRYQKPGGFEVARDLPVLLAILQSRVGREHRVLVAGALQNVVATSPQAYDRILAELPRTRMLGTVKGKNPFRDEEEEERVVKACVAYVDAQRARLLPDSDPLRGTRLSQWTNLKPLASALHQLPEEERTWREDEIMESWVFHAADRSLEGVFPSVIAKFGDQIVAPFFGDEAEEVTDVALVRHSDRVTPFILGTKPIQGLAERKNAYGFYAVRLNDIPIAEGMEPQTHELKWIHGDRKMTAQIDLSLTGDRPELIVPTDPAPRYDELWRPVTTNGPPTLTGLIVFGANLAGDAPEVVESYLAYFKGEGFEEEGEPEKLVDTKAFLRDQIVSGETSWFDKEAHSDGDAGNIFGVSRRSDLITLRRKEGGKEEVVRIVVPRPGGKMKEDLIPNREFGIWMRARANRAKKQLLFLNASCWSVDKGQNEIPEANTRYLAEILTESITDVFKDEEDNAMRILIDGIRKGKTYAEIRQDLLSKNSDYAKRIADRLVFPDEPEYLERVFHHFNPLRIRITMKDEHGRNYDGKPTDPCVKVKDL
jgi:hypothetical protein